MSANSLINNVCFVLPQSSAKFVELVIKKGNESYLTFRSNNNGRLPLRLPQNSLNIFTNTEDVELNSLSIIPEPFDQSPYTAMIYLLENLYDFNYDKNMALLFLSKCFHHSYHETENIKRKVRKILLFIRVRHLPYDVEVYKTLIQIYFGNNQSNNGFLSIEEIIESFINDLQRISNFFIRYQNGILATEFNRLIKNVARAKLLRFRSIQDRPRYQQFYNDLTAFIQTL